MRTINNPYARGKGGRGGEGVRQRKIRAKKWKKLSQVTSYANKRFWVNSGQKLSYRFYIGHTKSIEEILNPEFEEALWVQDIIFEKAGIQAPAVINVGWLCLACQSVVNQYKYSKLLQSQERFKDLPVAVKPAVHRLTPDEGYKSWLDPSSTVVLVVETAKDPMIQLQVVRHCKSIYNKDDVNHVMQRPGYSQFKFIPWYGDSGNPPYDEDRMKLLVRALRIHKNHLSKLKQIPVHDISDLYYTTEAFGKELTLEYLLMCMRTRTDWDTNLFFQVGTDRFGVATVICHEDEYKEANSVISNLYPLMKHKFGDKVKRWFTKAAILRAESTKFDQDTNTMKNTEDDELRDLLPERNYVRSPASVKAAVSRGLDLEDLEVFEEDDNNVSFNNESSEDDQERETMEFDLEEMFKAIPAVTKAPGHENESQHNFNTGATSSPLQRTIHSDRSRGSITTDAEDASKRQTGVESDTE